MPGSFVKATFLALVVAFLFAPHAEAIFSFSQTFVVHGETTPDDSSLPIAGRAVFTVQSGKLTLQLTNLTIDPTKASQLLTGFSFHLADADGTISNLTLQSAKTYARWVNSDGSFMNSKQQVDLLALDTWMMGDTELLSQPVPHEPLQGIYNLTFHPDAQYGIIGSPGADQRYANYQQPGLGPFAGETVTFVFASNQIDNDTKLDQVKFFFGTDFQASPIPEASTFLPLGCILGLAALIQPRRARRPAKQTA